MLSLRESPDRIKRIITVEMSQLCLCIRFLKCFIRYFCVFGNLVVAEVFETFTRFCDSVFRFACFFFKNTYVHMYVVFYPYVKLYTYVRDGEKT